MLKNGCFSYFSFRCMQDFREFDPDVQAMGQCSCRLLEVAVSVVPHGACERKHIHVYISGFR